MVSIPVAGIENRLLLPVGVLTPGTSSPPETTSEFGRDLPPPTTPVPDPILMTSEFGRDFLPGTGDSRLLADCRTEARLRSSAPFSEISDKGRDVRSCKDEAEGVDARRVANGGVGRSRLSAPMGAASVGPSFIFC